ncbi:unnamed protein product [Heterobilharzia americana]|nr:unnamed protein product [Heterobilharzia americana]
MEQQGDELLESKPKIQKRVDFLNDLDGLLVNSKNFNKLFIQRTSPEWIKSQVEKLVQSHIHLSKFVEVLTNFIVSENHHPHVVQQVLIWLDYLTQNHYKSLQSPEIQQSLKNLCSYYYEMFKMGNMYLEAANRGNAVENWSKAQKYMGHLPRRLYYTILPKTKFTYTDDGDKKSIKKQTVAQVPSSSVDIEDDFDIPNDDDDALMDLDSASSMTKDDELEYNEESVYQSFEESDAGVFDVNEPLSSDAEQHQQQNRMNTDDGWGEEDAADLFEIESDSDDFQYPDVNNFVDNLSVSSKASSTSSEPSTSLFSSVILDKLETPAASSDNKEEEGETKSTQSMASSDGEPEDASRKTIDKTKKKSSTSPRKSNDSVSSKSPDNRRKTLRSSSKKTTPKK